MMNVDTFPTSTFAPCLANDLIVFFKVIILLHESTHMRVNQFIEVLKSKHDVLIDETTHLNLLEVESIYTSHELIRAV